MDLKTLSTSQHPTHELPPLPSPPLHPSKLLYSTLIVASSFPTPSYMLMALRGGLGLGDGVLEGERRIWVEMKGEERERGLEGGGGGDI